jgi:hypothetical protein
MRTTNLIPIERVERKIILLRDQKVMLDHDLADLYGVPTKSLKRQVSRNIERFPLDFMFQLTQEEFNSVKSQFGDADWGGIRYLPLAFTEQGVATLSSVLRSTQAVQVNILIMRAFVKMRQMMIGYKELLQKLNELERKYEKHDIELKMVFDAIRQLAEPPKPALKRKEERKDEGGRMKDENRRCHPDGPPEGSLLLLRISIIDKRAKNKSAIHQTIHGSAARQCAPVESYRVA